MYHKNIKIHFVGIGGVGMAGIAEVLINLGYTVTGSDLKLNYLAKNLEKLGARIFIGHMAENILKETGVVVYSSAVSKENPEIIEAESRKIPVISRAEMLAELMRMKHGIAVGGSHGKTTTTSMVSHILMQCNLDPTVIVGGRLLGQASGASLGKGEFLVAESDESDGSFCLLKPSIAVVTNIDREHLNHYGTIGALERAFFEFMSSVPFYGAVVACFDDPVVCNLTGKLKRRVISYGLQQSSDLNASKIEIHPSSSTFQLTAFGKDYGKCRINIPGVHMVSNALAALGVASELDIDLADAIAALISFHGVARRSEVLFEQGEITVIDDYGHHPSEIKATLSAIRSGRQNRASGRLIAMFEPHRYTRVKELFSEFINCFSDADELLVGEIYPAGEEPIEGISGSLLASAMQHQSVKFIPNLNDAADGLKKSLKPGDTVVALGAGSISSIAHSLAENLRANAS